MKKILIFGSINTDLVFSVNELPLRGQTILSKKYETFFGGKGANQAVAVGKMGSKPTMVGQVGTDSNGEEAIANLKANNVDIKFIKKTKLYPTGVAGILVDDHADNVIIVDSGANNNFELSNVKEYINLIKTHDIILAQLELPVDFIFAIFQEAKKFGKTTILNPAPGIKLSEEQLQNCDFIIPNETELSIILDEPFTEEYNQILNRTQQLQKLSKKHVITTLGKNGSLYVGPDKIQKFDAIKVNAIDPTSAGDTFIGVFTHMQANEKSIEEAIQLATFAAALTVTETGAQPSIPTLELVESFKESFNNKN